jgi:hypothetical protein
VRYVNTSIRKVEEMFIFIYLNNSQTLNEINFLFRNFLLIDGAGLYVYSYDGRLQSTPKWQSMRTDLMNINILSISNDTIAVRDTDQKSSILFCDAFALGYFLSVEF